MGLPEILIEFKTKAQTAVTRSQNGIVAVILEDSTKVGDENLSYTYNYEADIVKSDWTTTNLDYLNKIFLGKPKRVLVERAETGEDFKKSYNAALVRLRNKSWNWLTFPGLEPHKDLTEELQNWIIAQRAAKKTFKAVLLVLRQIMRALLTFPRAVSKSEQRHIRHMNTAQELQACLPDCQ